MLLKIDDIVVLNTGKARVHLSINREQVFIFWIKKVSPLEEFQMGP